MILPTQSPRHGARFLTRLFPPVTTHLCRRMQPGLYRYVWRSTGRQQTRLLALTALLAPLTMVPLELQRLTVDTAIQTGELERLMLLGGLYLAVLLVQAGLKYVRNVYRDIVAEGVVRILRLRVTETVDERPSGARADGVDGPGAKVSMAAAEAERLGGFVAESLSQPLLDGGTFVVVIAYMMVIEPLIAAYTLVLFLPLALLVPPLQRVINRLVAHRTKLVRLFGDELAEAAEDGSGQAQRRHNRLIEQVYRTRVRIVLLKYLVKSVNNLLGNLGPLGVLLLGGWLVIQGETQIGTIVAFMSGFERLQQPARDLLNFYRRQSRMREQYRLFCRQVGTLPSGP